MSKHLTVILTIGLLAGSSCASGPPVTADDLKLKRVVIYRNGVAYFEREGHVEGERVRFKVRGDEVGDFLASFAVIEKGGSSVRAASFPLRHEEPATPPQGAGSKPADAKRRMETVIMELDGREHELAVGYIAEASRIRRGRVESCPVRTPSPLPTSVFSVLSVLSVVKKLASNVFDRAPRGSG